jgi:hypothetical protein
MPDTNETIVNWKENVTLRRFAIVTAIVMVWIGCDLALHAVVSGDVVMIDLWNTVEFNTKKSLSNAWFELSPIDAWRLHLYTAYSLPAFGLISLILLDRLVNQGRTGLPWGITACGGLFIVGGALFDMAVTVANSPDLEQEGNPYIRILLDSQHSLTFVYVHALVTQSLYITLFCGLWIGFLRHRQIIIDTISASSPASPLEFLKAATGGSHLTVRQWLFPIRLSEWPVIYHYLWLVAIPIVFGISLFRWYVAMEWVGVVESTESTRVLVVLHGVFSTLVLYLMALWRLYRISEDRNRQSACVSAE